MTNRLAARLSLLLVLAACATRTGEQDSNPADLLFTTALSVKAPKPTIVLVHGAFTDATGWQHVIPILRKDGYKVVAVENTLSSLAEDIATTRSVIHAQNGPVVLVGHSYGGAVITGAAAGLNVRALVYVAAFAPDTSESIGSLTRKYPSALGAALRLDPAGCAYIDHAQFRDVFAGDVPAEKARVMGERQKKVNPAVFDQAVEFPAWRTIRSWYLVSKEDRAINPELARFFAKRMGATTGEVRASHVAFISQPGTVARFIEEAAAATRR